MNYGSPYAYPGLKIPRVKYQVEDRGKERLNLTYENVLSAAIKIINKKNSTNYTREDVLSKSRVRDIVEIRQCAMFILVSNGVGTLKSIGRFFGGRDHSTVIHGNRNWGDLCDTDKLFREFTQRVMDEIRMDNIAKRIEEL